MAGNLTHCSLRIARRRHGCCAAPAAFHNVGSWPTENADGWRGSALHHHGTPQRVVWCEINLSSCTVSDCRVASRAVLWYLDMSTHDALARRVLTCRARGYLQEGSIGWLSFRGPAQCVPVVLISLTVRISPSTRPRARVCTTTISRLHLSMHVGIIGG